MARDIIADLWNTASESPRALEIQQKIEWVKEATSGAIMDTFEGEKPITSIHPTAKIDPSVKIPEGCTIGAHVFIEKGVKLSPKVSLWDRTIIEEWAELWEWVALFGLCWVGRWVKIWDFTEIWGGTTIYNAIIWHHNVFLGQSIVEDATIWDHNFFWYWAEICDRTIGDNQLKENPEDIYWDLGRILSKRER